MQQKNVAAKNFPPARTSTQAEQLIERLRALPEPASAMIERFRATADDGNE